MDPTSGSQTQESQAGAGVAGAGVGTAAQQASAQTGAAQAGAGAAGQGAQAEVREPLDDTPLYQGNFKRILANELDLDQELRQILVSSAQRLARNAEDFDQQIRNLALQSLADNQAVARRVTNQAITDDTRANDTSETFDTGLEANAVSERERTTRAGDIGSAVQWGSVAADESALAAVVAKVLAKMAAAGQIAVVAPKA